MRMLVSRKKSSVRAPLSAARIGFFAVEFVAARVDQPRAPVNAPGAAREALEFMLCEHARDYLTPARNQYCACTLRLMHDGGQALPRFGNRILLLHAGSR